MSVEGVFPDRTRIVSVERDDGATEVSLQVDGRGVSRAFIVPLLMRVGEAVVRMDGIGGVATEAPYRHRGYSRRVMEAAVHKMRAGDAALSALYGIPDFYPQFGFVTAGAEHTLTLPLARPAPAAAPLPPGWRFRAFAAGDLTAVMRLYRTNTRSATGAVRRHGAADEPAEHAALARANPRAEAVSGRAWDRLRRLGSEPSDDACRVLLNGSGELVAYAWVGRSAWWIAGRERDAPDAFLLGEVMAGDPEAADAVVAACRSWAVEDARGADRIEFVLPPEGPVAHAVAYEGGAFVGRYARRGDFMARVLDVDRLVRQLRPELSARMRAARAAFRGELILTTDEGAAALSVSADGVAAAPGSDRAQARADLPHGTLARLCLGAYDAADLLARLPRPPRPEVAALLQALFPRRSPHVYPADRF